MQLKEYLDSNDLSVQDFSAITGISESNIYKYLNRTAVPSYSTARLIEILTEGEIALKDLRESPR